MFKPPLIDGIVGVLPLSLLDSFTKVPIKSAAFISSCNFRLPAEPACFTPAFNLAMASLETRFLSSLSASDVAFKVSLIRLALT